MDGCDAVVHLAAAADVDEVALDPADAERSTRAAPSTCSRRARQPGVARRLRLARSGSTATSGDGRRRGVTPLAPARPPLHGDASSPARCTAAPTRALRPRLHDPALRHPLRAARPAGGRDPDLRAQGAGRRAADDRRRAACSRGASSTSRTSPTASSPASSRSPAAASTTSSGTRASRSARSPTRVRDVARRRRHRPHRAPRAATSPGAEVSGARAADELGWRPATSFSEGLRRYVDWHCRAAAEPDAPARREAGAALPAPPAARAAAGIPRPVVADGLRRGRRARGLSGRGERGRPDGRVGSRHRGAERQHAGRLPAMALDGPRKALWTFAGWALAAVGLVLVYMSEFREVLNLAGPDESRSCSDSPAARWPSRSPTPGCACGARARSAWPPTGRRARSSERDGLQARPLDGLEHCRQCLRRPTPRPGGAVVVGVVEQDDVARAQVARRAPGDGRAGRAARQSRPQRDHSRSRQPRRRTSARPAALKIP